MFRWCGVKNVQLINGWQETHENARQTRNNTNGLEESGVTSDTVDVSGKAPRTAVADEASSPSEVPIHLNNTFTPRTLGKILSVTDILTQNYTPRELRMMNRVIIPEGVSSEISLDPIFCLSASGCITENQNRQLLTSMFRDFIVEMNRGIYLTQIAATNCYCSIHCSLSDDLRILTLDQNTGRLVEFPCNGIHRVIMKEFPTPLHQLRPQPSDPDRPPAIIPKLDLRKLQEAVDYLVTVHFAKRKLVFVFHERDQAERFRICMFLLGRKMNTSTGTETTPKTVNDGTPTSNSIAFHGNRWCAKCRLVTTTDDATSYDESFDDDDVDFETFLARHLAIGLNRGRPANEALYDLRPHRSICDSCHIQRASFGEVSAINQKYCLTNNQFPTDIDQKRTGVEC